MMNLIIQLESAKTVHEINSIMYKNVKHFNSAPILDHVARKARKRLNKREFCPVCGSAYLLKHQAVWSDGEYKECGIWHTYRELNENGEYQCENGHEFRVEYNEHKEKFEKTII